MAQLVKDIDHGWRDIRKAFRQPSRYVHVGVQGADADALHGELTNAQLAAIHEYGSADGRIPERSFLRSTMEKMHAGYRLLLRRLGGAVATNRITADEALGIIGEKAVADVRATIRGGVSPANTPATIDRKGSSTPLIDTGQLINAITYEVK